MKGLIKMTDTTPDIFKRRKLMQGNGNTSDKITEYTNLQNEAMKRLATVGNFYLYWSWRHEGKDRAWMARLLGRN